MLKTADKPHVYEANLDDSSALQDFFEDSNLVVATRFFRHKELFQQFQGVVIPRLLRGSLPVTGYCVSGRPVVLMGGRPIP